MLEAELKWVRKAAENGCADAYIELARAYADVQDPMFNTFQAEAWARKALAFPEYAEEAQNILDALTELDSFMEQYHSLDFLKALDLEEQDRMEEAAEYYRAAADSGCAMAAYSLVRLHLHNGIESVTDQECFALCSMAAKADPPVPEAIALMALLYNNGTGTEVNLDLARAWAQKALHYPEVHDAAVELLEATGPADSRADPEADFREGCQALDQKDYAAAFGPMQKAAVQNHPIAMYNLAIFYLNGLGTEKDPSEAFSWCCRSADAGYEGAYPLLAALYFQGHGTEVDLDQAEFWAQKASRESKNQKAAQQILGQIEKARASSQPAPAPRQPRENSQEQMKRWISLGEQAYSQEDYSKSFRYFGKAAELGSAVAMNNLSFHYAMGYGTAHDSEKAFYWMKEAARNGFVLSYMTLAKKYLSADGTDFDADQARFWAEKAIAEGGDAEDANALLEYIRNTPDLEQITWAQKGDQAREKGNMQEAFRCYLHSAELGDPISMNNLSVAYINGDGTEVDCEKSFYWIKQAAEHGFPHAYSSLASKYLHGSGTRQNLQQAEFWARKALTEGGNQQDAQQILTEISQQTRKEHPQQNQPRVQPSDPVSSQEAEAWAMQGDTFREQGNAQEAFRCYLKGAQLGNAFAMNNVSTCYENGSGVAEDSQKSFYWMKQAAEHGLAHSYTSLAYKYLYACGTTQDRNQAEFWARKALEEGVNTKTAAEILYHQQHSQDPVRALAFYRKSREYDQRGDYENAFKTALKAAEDGYLPAMRSAAFFYKNGLGTAPDHSKALRLYEQSAENGDFESCLWVALEYLYGRGVPADMQKAKYFVSKHLNFPNAPAGYHKLCESVLEQIRILEENNGALESVAYQPQALQAFENGNYYYNQTADKEKGINCYLEAKRLGDPLAINRLGELCLWDRGPVSADMLSCIPYYTCAAYRGCYESIRHLGLHCERDAKTLLWAFYLQGLGCKDGENRYSELLSRKHDRGSLCKNARDAMIQAAQNMKNYQHTGSDQALRNAEAYFMEAAEYGDLDGLCGAAEIELIHHNGPEATNLFQLAAFMGHSYAMYWVGTRLENAYHKPIPAAVSCYRKAAQWGYTPAAAKLHDLGLEV